METFFRQCDRVSHCLIQSSKFEAYLKKKMTHNFPFQPLTVSIAICPIYQN